MKIGTIRSPWRYDAAARRARQRMMLPQYAILRYTAFAHRQSELRTAIVHATSRKILLNRKLCRSANQPIGLRRTWERCDTDAAAW